MQPVPVNIICGALGSGKTTAIANLLAKKPASESWVVILNEFTDTGLDTLTLASAARGSYDVRMIPGGCLCCTGEEDFRRQLSSLLNQVVSPARILIEPSGIGHPGSIIEELRVFERSGAITLSSTVALIDAQRMAEVDMLPDVARDQIDAADVVILSKAELVDAGTRSNFQRWADGLFPAKRFVGFSERAMLPPSALSPSDHSDKFSFTGNSSAHAHVHDIKVLLRDVPLAGFAATAAVHHYLNREACGWIIPTAVMFDLQKLEHGLTSGALLTGNVERFKAALRTGIERWHLLQRWNNQFELREIAWRNDSRIEVQMQEASAVDWMQWDRWIESTIPNQFPGI